MAKLHLRIWCEASYDTVMDVPDGLTAEEAFAYAQDHLDKAPMTELEYLPDSDNLDEADLETDHIWLEA